MNPFCPACGHKLDTTDERGVAAFTVPATNTQKFVCGRIDCMNVMLDYDYWILGIARQTRQANTCDGDCA